MKFSILKFVHAAVRLALLMAHRASGCIQAGALNIYRGAGRLQTALNCHRGTGRLAVGIDYRGSEHGLYSAFITTRTNGYPV